MRSLALTTCLAFAACEATHDDLADGSMALPRELHEVSGIAAVDADTVVGVQDESGVLYTIDLRGREPLRSAGFGPRGDYEGLARVGATWWVLRSDGWLGRLAARDGAWHIEFSLLLPGGPREWEALCYDAARARLLVLPKRGPGDDKEAREARPVLAVDPTAGTVAAEPVLVLARRDLLRAAEAKGLPLPVRTTPRGKERVDFTFECSELAVVPGSADLLLLSAVDHLLLRVGPGGELLASALLDPQLLPQPEGMTFLPDGRLVIASEGRDGAARLVVVAVP